MDAPGIEVPGVDAARSIPLDAEAAVRANYFDKKLADDAIARAFDPANEDVRLSNQRTVAKLAWQPRYHDPHLQRWLHRIRIPTLIVWGADDRLFPPAYGAAWQKAIAGSRLAALPRCGHLPIQEKPEEFAKLVGEFCAEAGRYEAAARRGEAEGERQAAVRPLHRGRERIVPGAGEPPQGARGDSTAGRSADRARRGRFSRSSRAAAR